MRTAWCVAVVVVAGFAVVVSPCRAAVGTAFTYQGRFNDGSNPANGPYDFEFKLFDAATAGTQVGSTVTKEDLAVSDGYFTTALDFGSSAFTGNQRWLQIAVRPGASTDPYSTLSPRHEMTPVPYAMNSATSGTANYIPKSTGTGLADSLLYESSGNIGIGTTSPGADLDVQGGADSMIRTYGSGNPYVAAVSSDNSVFTILQSLGSSSLGTVGTSSNHPFAIRTNNGTRMYISTSGKIGIGTTSPTSKLQIKGLSGSGDESPLILQYAHAPAVGDYLGIDWTGSTVTNRVGRVAVEPDATGDFNMDFYTSTDNGATQTFVMRLTDDGNVGIGTTSPGYLLTTADTNTLTAVNLSNVMYVDAQNNRVGIGFADPVCDLDIRNATVSPGINVQGPYNPALELRSTTGGIALIDFSNDSSIDYDMRIWLMADDTLAVDGGNFGVSTTAPTQRLDVNGNIHCSGVLYQDSDEQLKTDVQPLGGVLDKLGQVRAVSFTWNEKAQALGAIANTRQIGVLAQELEQVFPEMVNTPTPVTVDELLKSL